MTARRILASAVHRELIGGRESWYEKLRTNDD
jgi:hypothetical protein